MQSNRRLIEQRANPSNGVKITLDLDGHLREEEEIFFPAIKRVEADRKNGSTPKRMDFEDDLHRHVHLENNILFLKVEQL